MVPKPQTTKDHILRGIGYFLIAAIVAVGTWLLVKFASGYQINPKTGEVYRVGLVLIETEPIRAQVWIDGQDLHKRSPEQFSLPAGDHLLELKFDGYRDWSKEISLEESGVLWVNYAWLIPQELQPATVLTLDSTETIYPAHNNEEALVVDSKTAALSRVDLERSTIEVNEISLPADIQETLEDWKFRGVTWSGNNRHALLRFVKSNSTRHVLLDTRNPGRSVDINDQFQLDISNIQFKTDSGDELYAIAGGSLRLLDVGDNTVTGSLVKDVHSFESSAGQVTIVTNPDEEGLVKILNLVGNETDPTQLVESELETQQIKIANGVVENRRAVAVSDGDKVMMWQDVNQPLSREELRFNGAGRVDFSSGGRYLLVQDGGTFLTYDFELEQIARFEIADVKKVKWLDDFHLGGLINNQAVIFEFDGENLVELTTDEEASSMFIGSDFEFSYALSQPVEDERFLYRTPLVN